MARIRVRITSRINLDKRNQRNGATKCSRDFSNLIQIKTTNPSLSNSGNVTPEKNVDTQANNNYNKSLLSVMLVNARFRLNKINAFELLIKMQEADIVCITET